MNPYLTIAFALMVFLVPMMLIPVFAQAGSVFSVSTSENTYEVGDTIVIFGQVQNKILSTPITVQIFHQTNLVENAQLEVAQNGWFVHTVLAKGPMWSQDGKYIVRASYGEDNVAEISFDFLSGHLLAGLV